MDRKASNLASQLQPISLDEFERLLNKNVSSFLDYSQINDEAIYGLLSALYLQPVRGDEDEFTIENDKPADLQKFILVFVSLFSTADRNKIFERNKYFEKLLKQDIKGKKDALVRMLAILKLAVGDILTGKQGICSDPVMQKVLVRAYTAILQHEVEKGKNGPEIEQHLRLLDAYIMCEPRLGGTERVLQFLFPYYSALDPQKAKKLKLSLLEWAELARKLPDDSPASFTNWVAIFHHLSKPSQLDSDAMEREYTGLMGMYGDITQKENLEKSLRNKLVALMIFTYKERRFQTKRKELQAKAASVFEQLHPQFFTTQTPANFTTSGQTFDDWKQENVDVPLAKEREEITKSQKFLESLEDKDPIKIQFLLHRGLFAFERLQEELSLQPVAELSSEQKTALEQIIADLSPKARLVNDDGYASFMLYQAVNLLELSQKEESRPPAIYWLYRSVFLNYIPADDLLITRMKSDYIYQSQHLPWDLMANREQVLLRLKKKHREDDLTLALVENERQPEEGNLKKFASWFKSEPLKEWPRDVPAIEAPRSVLSNKRLILDGSQLNNAPSRWTGNTLTIFGFGLTSLAGAFFAMGVLWLATHGFNLTLLAIGVSTGILGIGVIAGLGLTIAGIYLLNQYASGSFNAQMEAQKVPVEVKRTYGAKINLLFEAEVLGPLPDPQALSDSGDYPGQVFAAAELKKQMAQPGYKAPLQLVCKSEPYMKIK